MYSTSALLTRDCSSAEYRCHKKADEHGRSICRFKTYQPCNETFRRHVDRLHSPQVWQLLKNLNLATEVPGHSCTVQLIKWLLPHIIIMQNTVSCFRQSMRIFRHVKGKHEHIVVRPSNVQVRCRR